MPKADANIRVGADATAFSQTMDGLEKGIVKKMEKIGQVFMGALGIKAEAQSIASGFSAFTQPAAELENVATKLKATRIPAWVKRHGIAEGACRITRKRNRITIIITNAVPYNEAMTMRRAAFVLDKVERGFDGNLRALKRKLIKSIR